VVCALLDGRAGGTRPDFRCHCPLGCSRERRRQFDHPAAGQQLGRLGAHPVSPAAAWIGYEFVFLAALLAFGAAAQISAVRSEEADGQLDNLLARHLDRSRWLAGRLGFSVALVLACGLAAGAGGWLGIAGRTSAVGFAAMMQAGLNAAVPALFVLGLGTLLYGLAPRLAAPVLYAAILWSLLVEIIGSSITSNTGSSTPRSSPIWDRCRPPDFAVAS